MSVAVPHHEQASTDDKRIFGMVKRAYKDSYTIQTRHGVLDQNFPTSELMPHSDNIDLRFSDPPPSKKFTLRYVAAQENTTAKVPVHCGCRG